MEEKIVVRNALTEDEDRIVEIALEQWRIIYENYERRMTPEIYAAYHVSVESALLSKEKDIRKNARDLDYCFVTEVDGVVAGFAHYRIENIRGIPCGVVGHNAVDNRYKGRGIAGRQYAKIYDGMRERGCKYAKVHTGLDEMHAPARRAYEKSGFSYNLPDVNYYRVLKTGDEIYNAKPTDEAITVRPATPLDEQRVLEIAKQQWISINENYKKCIGEELYSVYFGTVESRVSDVLRALSERMKNHIEQMVVTEVDGVVAGFATYGTEELPGGAIGGVLGRNGVDNAYKGRGIAGRQYAALYEKMLALGCTFAKVHTGLDERHAPARRAYEKSGFSNNLPTIMYYMML